jgi:hypothetical protein
MGEAVQLRTDDLKTNEAAYAALTHKQFNEASCTSGQAHAPH